MKEKLIYAIATGDMSIIEEFNKLTTSERRECDQWLREIAAQLSLKSTLLGVKILLEGGDLHD